MLDDAVRYAGIQRPLTSGRMLYEVRAAGAFTSRMHRYDPHFPKLWRASAGDCYVNADFGGGVLNTGSVRTYLEGTRVPREHPIIIAKTEYGTNVPGVQTLFPPDPNRPDMRVRYVLTPRGLTHQVVEVRRLGESSIAMPEVDQLLDTFNLRGRRIRKIFRIAELPLPGESPETGI